MAAVVVAPKVVVVKVADQQVVAVAKAKAKAKAKGMVVDGQVERASHQAEGAAMHRLAVAKSRFSAALA